METRQKRPQLSQGNSATVTPRDPLRGPSYCNRGNLARKAKSIHTTSNHFQKCTRTNRRTERNATRSNRLGLGSRATATTVKHDAGAEPTQTAPKRRDLSSRAAAHHHTEQQRAEERCGGAPEPGQSRRPPPPGGAPPSPHRRPAPRSNRLPAAGTARAERGPPPAPRSRPGRDAPSPPPPAHRAPGAPQASARGGEAARGDSRGPAPHGAG